MGWYESPKGGAVVGDEALDALWRACQGVVGVYTAGLRRPPTVAEWETLLTLTFGGNTDDDAIIRGVVV